MSGAALVSSPHPGIERPLGRAADPGTEDDCPAPQVVKSTIKGWRVVVSGRDKMERFLPVSLRSIRVVRCRPGGGGESSRVNRIGREV